MVRRKSFAIDAVGNHVIVPGKVALREGPGDVGYRDADVEPGEEATEYPAEDAVAEVAVGGHVKRPDDTRVARGGEKREERQRRGRRAVRVDDIGRMRAKHAREVAIEIPADRRVDPRAVHGHAHVAPDTDNVGIGPLPGGEIGRDHGDPVTPASKLSGDVRDVFGDAARSRVV